MKAQNNEGKLRKKQQYKEIKSGKKKQTRE